MFHTKVVEKTLYLLGNLFSKIVLSMR